MDNNINNNNGRGGNLSKLVFAALIMGMILIATSFFRIPVPMTQGYVNLGDAVIFLGVLLLGRKYGAVAAGLGASLGDVLGGYAFFAPWTFLIKFAMAFVCGLIIEAAVKKSHGQAGKKADVLAMTVGGLVMVAGYLIVEIPMYGNAATALAEVPWNICQFIVGECVALAIGAALSKTPAKRYFALPM